MTDYDPTRFVRKFPDKCCAEVTRKHQSQPCDAVAVAVAESTEAYDPDWWPVCQRHLRGRQLVPLEQILDNFAVCTCWAPDYQDEHCPLHGRDAALKSDGAP